MKIKQTNKHIAHNYNEYPVLQGTSVNTVLTSRCTNYLKENNICWGNKEQRRKLRTWHARCAFKLSLKINTGLELEERNGGGISGKANK